MSFANIIFAIISWMCALIFVIIALWSFKRKDPMHFWSGSTVRPEEIEDIPSYNRANGLMWLIYGISIAVTGILSLFNIKIAAILLVIICVPGIALIILVYNMIYKKYKSTSFNYKTDDIVSKTTKTPKAFIVAATLFSAIILIVIGVMIYYSEKEPSINILDDSLQIKAIYGENIEFAEIASISLIDKSMSDIGIGTRTNGYGGFGETLKGNFKSGNLGEILLFVESRTSPTIKIERIDKKDVFMSLSNSESTEQLYQELIAAIQ